MDAAPRLVKTIPFGALRDGDAVHVIDTAKTETIARNPLGSRHGGSCSCLTRQAAVILAQT